MLYFDHSATTPIHPKVLALLNDVESYKFGNPSSAHAFGQKSRLIIENSRAQVAHTLGCLANEVIFTSGGTEANNLVLWNLIHKKKKHIITSAIEHPSILNTLRKLTDFGISSTIIPVDGNCRIEPNDIKNAITNETGLISIMFANNEVGTIQPIEEIALIADENGIPFHVDAVQTPGKLSVKISKLKIKMLSFSAHKFYGPKGIGALFIKKDTALNAQIIGGGQENNLRAGTENIPGIAGMGLAMKLAEDDLEERTTHLYKLTKLFKQRMKNAYPDLIYNGHPDFPLPGVISVTFPKITNNFFIIKLNLQGIAVSSGSACSSGTVKASHVLKAMRLSNDHNNRTLRISFGKDNTEEDVDILSNKIIDIINQQENSNA